MDDQDEAGLDRAFRWWIDGYCHVTAPWGSSRIGKDQHPGKLESSAVGTPSAAAAPLQIELGNPV